MVEFIKEYFDVCNLSCKSNVLSFCPNKQTCIKNKNFNVLNRLNTELILDSKIKPRKVNMISELLVKSLLESVHM